MSLGFPNAALNIIVAESIVELTDELEKVGMREGGTLTSRRRS